MIDELTLEFEGPHSPTQSTSQVEWCYLEIRRLIVTCEFPPASRLNEKALIERLGMGRTPVREALLRLNQDGLLEIRQRSGYIVRPLDLKSIEDVLLAWGGIVATIVKSAHRNMTAGMRRELLDRLKKLEKATEGNPLQSALYSGLVMTKLVQIGDCEPLIFFYRHISANLERISRLLHLIPHEGNWSGSLAFVADIIREEDADKAASTARDRVAQSNKELLKFLVTHPENVWQEPSILPNEVDTPAKGRKARQGLVKAS